MKPKAIFFLLLMLISITITLSCTKDPSDEEFHKQYREIGWNSLRPEEKDIVITPIQDAVLYETTYRDIWSYAVEFRTFKNNINGRITVYIHAADKVYIGKLIEP